LVLHPTAGPVPNYLTLQGGPREVELGAFLSEDERVALKAEVQVALTRLRQGKGPEISPRPGGSAADPGLPLKF